MFCFCSADSKILVEALLGLAMDEYRLFILSKLSILFSGLISYTRLGK
ncbi:hypothetical protein SYN60AY4M2_00310 [Synechococcus sp. 60AY4M2]|jgi:hypothetical protein|nr:hypothetical protein SYN65AY6A5_03565 [Synechococcus sp. 65AY6A5]PIK96331.1 hypothetical protein SYN60AY4M2_00310 [Synechococcus sp. 60AY4M2]PIK99168.1 hypothetical protein SYN63AY4M1_11240 [Synechococcus sp. 63AY4M1]PIL02383.1 hypothetical protein SYN65AY640_02785 [Synechococcus sp. 65AY640]